MKCQLLYTLLTLCISFASGGFSDYLNSVSSYFTISSSNNDEGNSEVDQNIPYEVSLPDEKFISQAIQLSGVQQSELDSCQHRVVLRLHTACHKMNDEQLAKMAVALLNCQSMVEGRRVYPCTDSMGIKDCTIDMDADTWNTYHLMSNRARAVCYSIRQVQFRGITEQTVNRLMDAAKSQLSTLGKIAQDQGHIQQVAENTLNTVSQGYKELADQQEDIKKAQLYGQLSIEDNIRRLTDEKRLIGESQEQLSKLTKSVYNRLENAAKQLDQQSDESRNNHQELLDDMTRIQHLAQLTFQRIEESSKILLEQSKLAADQYDFTLKQLSEVNNTVHSLVNLLASTKEMIDEKLNWIANAMGGTDLAIERLYVILWHSGFLLLSMIACAFLSARISTRVLVSVLPLVNMTLALYNNELAQDAFTLSTSITVIITVQTIILFGMSMRKPTAPALAWKKTDSATPSPVTSTSSYSPKSYNIDNNEENDLSHSFRNSHYSFEKSSLFRSVIPEDEEDFNNKFSSPTPPLSRNGRSTRSRTPSVLSPLHKSSCSAKTRLGTPCKLNPIPGRDFCHRHQHGDSIMG